jgi:hypothetical protein
MTGTARQTLAPGGHHVHSVWRDVDGDWGRDVLAEHDRRGRQAGAPPK